MYNLFTIIFISLALLAHSFKIAPHRVPGHHIHEWKLKAKSNAPTHLKNAMNGTIDLIFETAEFMFELDLTIYEYLYAPHAKIIGWDDKGNEIEYEKRHRSFHGTAIVTKLTLNDTFENARVGTASVTFYEDNIFHAVIITENDIFTIDRKELHTNDERTGPVLGSDNGHGMVMVRQSDVINKNTEIKEKISEINRKLLASVTVFYNCYTGQFEYVRAIAVGIVTDNTFWKVYSYDNSLTLSAVEAIFTDNAANVIYYKQLNLRLTIGTTYIGSSASSLAIASFSSSYDMNAQLDSFTSWRRTYYNSNPQETNGLWHLLTNSHPPPGVVGLAWVGVICSYSSGTGITNYINPATSYYGTGTWHTFAHEVGHNFGANHAFQEGQGTTGGIMDYGDGEYPLGSGIYQFHPTYNQKEVCAQISSSMTDSTNRKYYSLLDVSKCWYQYSRTTPAPTTPKPTSKPTVSSPTVTPRPTFRPTYKPTSKPTTPSPTTSNGDDAGYYEWYETGQYSSCWPSCGTNSYKTAVLGCYQKVIYSTTYYYYTQVDSSLCDAATKPMASQIYCQPGYDVPYCSGVCGDGIVSKGEVCDTATSTGSCCNAGCQSYKKTLACWLVNPVIDAAFQDNSGRVYLFQGPYYARYSSYVYGSTSNKPDYGFPKTIAGSFPIRTWTEDIGAIAYKSDSEIWVFKGLQYTKIDLNSGELSGYPKYFTTDYSVPSSIISCGSIDGAVALSYLFMVFCDDIYGYVYFDKSYIYDSVRSISDFGKTAETVNAVYNYAGSSTVYIFSTKDTASSSVASAQSIFFNSNITDLNQVNNQSCYDENCDSCSMEDTQYCMECRSNYTLYNNFKCLEEKILVYLDMDNSSLSTDYHFIENGYKGLENMVYVDSATGIYHTGILFNGTTKLPLKPLNYAEDDALEEIEISVRLYPYSIMNDILLTIDELVYIMLVNVSENNVTRIEFTVGNNTFLSLTENPILINAWNTITLSYIDDTFSVEINGEEQVQAYSDWSGIDVKLYFNDWYLGSDTNSINGILDEVVISRSNYYSASTDNGAKSSDNDSDITNKTWFIVVITLISFGVIAACCVGGFYWHKKQKEVDHVNGYQKF